VVDWVQDREEFGVCRPHHLSSAMCAHGQSVATQVIDAGAPIDFFRIASDIERSGTS